MRDPIVEVLLAVCSAIAVGLFVLLTLFLFLSIPAPAQQLHRATLEDSPLEQARSYQVRDGLHTKYQYQVGLLWEQRIERIGDRATTYLKLSDPLKPLLSDLVELRVCGDISKLVVTHSWFVLVYSRETSRRNVPCRNIIAVYKLEPSDEAPTLEP